MAVAAAILLMAGRHPALAQALSAPADFALPVPAVADADIAVPLPDEAPEPPLPPGVQGELDRLQRQIDEMIKRVDALRSDVNVCLAHIHTAHHE